MSILRNFQLVTNYFSDFFSTTTLLYVVSPMPVIVERRNEKRGSVKDLKIFFLVEAITNHE